MYSPEYKNTLQSTPVGEPPSSRSSKSCWAGNSCTPTRNCRAERTECRRGVARAVPGAAPGHASQVQYGLACYLEDWAAIWTDLGASNLVC